MNKCKECAVLTKNPNFCSKSCAAKTNNKKYPKRVSKRGQCVFCRNELKANQFKYCSIKCSSENVKKVRIEKWLETGEGQIAGWNNAIRQYLYKEQNNKCVICQRGNKWENQELRFILDHIDGNHENNQRSNLRLVCPNCDSQLPTYKAKNKGNGRYSRRVRYNLNNSY